MPILVTLTINSIEHRVSLEGVALEHYWDAYVIDFESISFSGATDHGGYVVQAFGSITVSFDPFSSAWPPPVSIGVKIEFTETTEAESQLVFEGSGHRQGFSRDGVQYGLYGAEFDAMVAAPHTCNSTLDAAVAYLAGTLLNLDVDYTYARSPSPAIQHQIDSDMLAIDVLKTLCEYFSHLCYIENGTIYLIDCLGYSTSRTLTEFDVFPSTYSRLSPISYIEHSEHDFVVSSSYPYGDPYSYSAVLNTTEADIIDNWENMLTLMERDRASISLPMTGVLPKPGQRLILTDESMSQNITATMYIRGLRYDFVNETVECDCDGVIA